MDVFKLLSRGANLKSKHKEQLKLLNSDASAQDTEAVDVNVDFFSKSKPRRKAHTEKSQPEERIETITTQQEADNYKSINKIRITGSDIPLPIASFDDLTRKHELDEKLRQNLTRYSFAKPTPIQSVAIPSMLDLHDIVACAPTGSGKTLAFIVPILNLLLERKTDGTKKLRACVVTPTRELCGQIFQVASELAPRSLNVQQLNKKFLAKLRNNNAGMKKNMDLLITTPMRLVEAAQESQVDLSTVEYLVLDESDRLLGDGFVEQTDEIVHACTNPSLRKAVFSATMPSNVEELAKSIMDSPIRIIVGMKEAASENVEQKLQYCGNEQGKLVGIRQMLKGGEVVPPILVFVQSIQRAKALFHELIFDKISVDVIHSELTQNQRDRVINNFKEGKIWVLICTDVLSRGIDFAGVNLVINYDVPLTAQAYVHRIGRTGRAGRKGKAVTFFTKDDLDSIRTVANVMKQSGCEVPDWILTAGKSHKHKASRKQRAPIEREQISTVPRSVRHGKRQRHEMIEASKRRKNEDPAAKRARPEQSEDGSEPSVNDDE